MHTTNQEAEMSFILSLILSFFPLSAMEVAIEGLGSDGDRTAKTFSIYEHIKPWKFVWLQLATILVLWRPKLQKVHLKVS